MHRRWCSPMMGGAERGGIYLFSSSSPLLTVGIFYEPPRLPTGARPRLTRRRPAARTTLDLRRTGPNYRFPQGGPRAGEAGARGPELRRRRHSRPRYS